MLQSRYMAVLLALTLGAPVGAHAQEGGQAPLEVRVWLDRGPEPVLHRGDQVRIYYRTSHDAYVAIFHIDTDGSARLLFPRSPAEDYRTAAARDYRLLSPRAPYWYVDEPEGKGYLFALASPVPFDFSGIRYAAHAQSWDLEPVGRTVYRDPYLAMDDYVAALLPGWETVPYALDFLSYDVERSHDYPRFLCYDCHGFRSFASWNPYTYACTSFRVVIWDDPYFYPTYRYGPTRVVFEQPPRARARFGVEARDPGEAWSPVTRTRQPPRRPTPEYLEPSAAEPDRARIAEPRRTVVPPAGGRSAVPRSGDDRSERPAARRPSAASGSRLLVPGTGRPGLRPSREEAERGAGAERAPARGVRPADPAEEGRPTLQRRPGVSPMPSGDARPSDGVRGREPGRSVPTRVIRPGTPTRPGATRPSAGGTPPVVRPPSSGRPSTGRPTVRPGSSRPSVRPGGSRPSARPTPRPGSSRPAVRPKRPPPKRPGG